MKKIIGLSCICLLVTAFISPVFSQADLSSDAQSYENYVRSNIAISKFKVLGVNRKQYAKCLQTENFLEPESQLKYVVIDKTTFADDGNGYDLKAGDGILTSTELFTYTKGAPVEGGTYQETAEYHTIITDPLFEHTSEAGRSSSIGIKCKTKFVPCNQLSEPAHQWLCNWAGWPYGEIIFYDCQIDFSIF